MVEQFGSVTLLHGTLYGSDQALISSLPGIHDPNRMTLIQTFSVAPEHIHLFDQNSGKRITA